MERYDHTQDGLFMQMGLGLTVVGFWTAAIFVLAARHERGVSLTLFGVGALLMLILFLFKSLTVAVSGDEIRLTFGIGLIRKRIRVSEIESAAIVRNRWYYGWGIKLIPGGWLYNVSGLDAVELQLQSGRKIRIGTDQPAKLLKAIEASLNRS